MIKRFIYLALVLIFTVNGFSQQKKSNNLKKNCCLQKYKKEKKKGKFCVIKKQQLKY
jgi:hypothetical protein